MAYTLAQKRAIDNYRLKNKEVVLGINRKSYSKYYEKNKQKEKERILNNYHWKKISKIFLNILLN
jgi:hypothetical protein